MKFGCLIFEICEWTDRHTDTLLHTVDHSTSHRIVGAK